MSGLRRDLSSLGLVVATLATLAGWLLTFTQVGAELATVGLVVALASAALYPTRRRALFALWIASLYFFALLVGGVVGVLILLFELILLAKRRGGPGRPFLTHP